MRELKSIYKQKTGSSPCRIFTKLRVQKVQK